MRSSVAYTIFFYFLNIWFWNACSFYFFGQIVTKGHFSIFYSNSFGFIIVRSFLIQFVIFYGLYLIFGGAVRFQVIIGHFFQYNMHCFVFQLINKKVCRARQNYNRKVDKALVCHRCLRARQNNSSNLYSNFLWLLTW